MERQSQEALDQMTTSDEIVTSIETHGVEVAATLTEKWMAVHAPPGSTPQADAPNPPDYLGQLFALRDGLNASKSSLGQADQTHVYQLARLIQLRDDRAGLTDSLYTQFSTARRTIDELHGEGKAFLMAAIQGPTARTTKKLLRQVEVSLPQLHDPSLKQTEPKVEGITVDPPAMARGLDNLAGELRTTQAEFQRMRRVVQASRKEKVRRLEEHRSTTVWTARIVEGYYQLAGETELAERLRPAVSRAGRPPAKRPTEGSPAPEEAAPDNGTPDDSAPVEPIGDGLPPEEGTGEG